MAICLWFLFLYGFFLFIFIGFFYFIFCLFLKNSKPIGSCVLGSTSHRNLHALPSRSALGCASGTTLGQRAQVSVLGRSSDAASNINMLRLCLLQPRCRFLINIAIRGSAEYMHFYFMGIWLSARFTHAACEKAEKWINKVERKINKIRCRKHSLPIAFLSCVCRWTKLAARLSTLAIVTSVSSTGRSNREFRRSSSRPCWAALTSTHVHVLDHFSRLLFAPLSSLLQCQAPRHRPHPSSPLSTKLFCRLLKFQSFRLTPAPLHAPT